VSHCFKVWGLDELQSGGAPENRASLHVLEKLGFEFERMVQPDGVDGQIYRHYRLTREVWVDRTSQA
jgi:RimJ/RimL family protein N-acetyltransferase